MARRKPLTWDVTVACSMADSYVDVASRGAGSVAELAAARKSSKYAGLAAGYMFQPIAVETLGPINDSACDFLISLGRKISAESGELREGSLLFQWISMLI